eukprot:5734432-Pleurochrysis_carterae.AAC.2
MKRRFALYALAMLSPTSAVGSQNLDGLDGASCAADEPWRARVVCDAGGPAVLASSGSGGGKTVSPYPAMSSGGGCPNLIGVRVPSLSIRQSRISSLSKSSAERGGAASSAVWDADCVYWDVGACCADCAGACCADCAGSASRDASSKVPSRNSASATSPASSLSMNF